MVGLTALVASIAIADSINPSTVVPALWLASARDRGALAGFTLGVFAVYLAGGLVLLLGPGPAVIALFHHLRGPLEHGLQAIGGVLALALALVLWRSRNRTGGQPGAPRSHTGASGFALGAGIMVVELPTAFMYFGAISATLAAHAATPLAIGLLIAYNALFVAPLVGILGVTRFAGERADRLIAAAGERLRYLGRLALAGVTGVAGAAPLAVGLAGL